MSSHRNRTGPIGHAAAQPQPRPGGPAVDGLRIEVERERAARLAAEAQLAEIRGSTSWRVTAPLRSAGSSAQRVAAGTRRHLPSPVRRVLRGILSVLRPTHSAAPLVDVAAGTSDDHRAEVLARRTALVLETLGHDPHGGRPTLEHALADASATSPSWWLTFAVLTATLPQDTRLVELEQTRLTSGAAAALDAVEQQVKALPGNHPALSAAVQVVSETVLIDASVTAGSDLRSGIQRVVRATVPHWTAMGARPIVLDADRLAWRHATASEAARLAGRPAPRDAEGPAAAAVVVPWNCDLLLPEVPALPAIPLLAAAAHRSGSRLSWIGYDLIPLLAPAYVPDGLVLGTVRYAAMLQHAHRVAAISHSSAAEFAGYVAGLGSQGIQPPQVAAVTLPMTPPPAASADGDREAYRLRRFPERPLFLYVSSISPHKNQDQMLTACTLLSERWDEFEVLFIAPNAWQDGPFRARLEALTREGLAASLAAEVSEAALWSLYRQARATVLLSRVEGYGLPIVESLSVGTPVVCSDFGSMSEVSPTAALHVDPTDATAVAGALTRLLDDRGLVARLRAEAAELVPGSWPAYAQSTWSWLIDGSSATSVDVSG